MSQEKNVVVIAVDNQETCNIVVQRPSQSGNDLDGYATEQYVDNAVNDMATQTWVNNQIQGFKPIVPLTQAEYDALGTPDENTLYLITDAL